MDKIDWPVDDYGDGKPSEYSEGIEKIVRLASELAAKYNITTLEYLRRVQIKVLNNLSKN